jgi:hypothetical protein
MHVTASALYLRGTFEINLLLGEGIKVVVRGRCLGQELQMKDFLKGLPSIFLASFFMPPNLRQIIADSRIKWGPGDHTFSKEGLCPQCYSCPLFFSSRCHFQSCLAQPSTFQCMG